MSATDRSATTFQPFTSIRALRLPEQVARQIQEAIFRGDFVPGQRLPTERELMQQFQTSRATVREALRILERAALVQVRAGAGGGSYVAEPSYQLISQSLRQLMHLNQFRVAELHQARLLLEPGIAYVAAQAARPEHVGALQEAVEQARDLAAGSQETSSASLRFHLVLAQASGNRLLEMLDLALLELAAACDAARVWTKKGTLEVLSEHQALLEAVRERKADQAQRLMEAHLQGLLSAGEDGRPASSVEERTARG